MTLKALTYNQLGITPADIYEAMGYRGTQPDEATVRETEAILDDVREWLRPQFCSRSLNHCFRDKNKLSLHVRIEIGTTILQISSSEMR